uniref:hypothetical protein n=1 Tax=Helicobacter suis TaxID=104628 RepID=UPI0013CFF4F3
NQEIPFEQLNQRMIKPEEFTDSVVKELKKRPKLHVWIGEADNAFKPYFGETDFQTKYYLNGDTIKRTLKDHGAKSEAVKSGKELPITIEDLINYPKTLMQNIENMRFAHSNAKGAPVKDVRDQKNFGGLCIAKQFKDHYLIAHFYNDGFDLILHTMAKVKGNFKESEIFKIPDNTFSGYKGWYVKDGEIVDKERYFENQRVRAFGTNFKEFYH